ncbi:MAG: transposase [Fischerella sp. CENA71]|nr:transposase [Fischerella sp. CENA71]
MMETEAADAQKAGRIRVIVQDNGPIHRCKQVQELWTKWEEMGLYIFFLPKYCSEMNPIELEWQHLKKDELAAKSFGDELDASLMLSLMEFKLEEKRVTIAYNVSDLTLILLLNCLLHTYKFFPRLTYS